MNDQKTPDTYPASLLNVGLGVTRYTCGHCQHVGRGGSVATSEGFSAAWCRRCGRNDKMMPKVELREHNEH